MWNTGIILAGIMSMNSLIFLADSRTMAENNGKDMKEYGYEYGWEINKLANKDL